jgi:hypothetical protein
VLLRYSSFGFEIGDHHLEKSENTEKPVLEFRIWTGPIHSSAFVNLRFRTRTVQIWPVEFETVDVQTLENGADRL